MKTVYIISFIIFGLLLQFLIHAGLEIWYINLLIADFPRYSLGFSWNNWGLIHDYGALIFAVLGIWFGYSQGKLWWKRIYAP